MELKPIAYRATEANESLRFWLPARSNLLHKLATAIAVPQHTNTMVWRKKKMKCYRSAAPTDSLCMALSCMTEVMRSEISAVAKTECRVGALVAAVAKLSRAKTVDFLTRAHIRSARRRFRCSRPWYCGIVRKRKMQNDFFAKKSITYPPSTFANLLLDFCVVCL